MHYYYTITSVDAGPWWVLTHRAHVKANEMGDVNFMCLIILLFNGGPTCIERRPPHVGLLASSDDRHVGPYVSSDGLHTTVKCLFRRLRVSGINCHDNHLPPTVAAMTELTSGI